MDFLPIDDYLTTIVDRVRAHRAAVVTAAPGAGKTTRVPPAFVDDGPVLLLQPRRVAARAIARRIAAERGWTIGREIGWHVRFERRSSPDTRLLVVTEGMLTARLQHDPLLEDVRTLIVDEFHERSIHADLGLALARQAWLARQDLRIVVMSATLDAGAVSRFLEGCPVIDVPGRLFPVDVTYRPGVSMDRAAVDVVTGESGRGGAILCFLPGAPEIRRTADALARSNAMRGVPVLPLHGGLDAEAQDAALNPSGGPRIILATNLAETTVTVPDVTCVIDSGLQKVARYDAARAIDSLELERVSGDSAEQRAGRAGRTRAGAAIRLWDSRDRLRPHREPDIARIDLAGPALEILAWGGAPAAFEWFEAPPAPALDGAMRLLERLGAIDSTGRITALGRRMQRIPAHPRLARLLLTAHGSRASALAAALLSERHFVPPRHDATSCDLLAAIGREDDLPGHLRGVADQLQRITGAVLAESGAAPFARRADDEAFRRAVLDAYPDRVARRRAPLTDRLVLSSGTGAKLSRESGVHNAEFLVAVDVTAGAAGGEALVRLATGIEREWLPAASRDVKHWLDERTGAVRAAMVERYDALMLSEHPCAPEAVEAARLIAEAYVRRGPSPDDLQWLRRLAFAGEALTFEDLVRTAAAGAASLDAVDVSTALPAAVRRRLDRDAPTALRLPSGRQATIDYRESGPFAAVKLQALFGLTDTPRLGPARVPITFEILAPNNRPVQVTSDLGSFWARGYPEVRKQLRGRYPKHAWPERPGVNE